MDEPTLDCYCGTHARLEIQLQTLTNDARWSIYHRSARCLEHSAELLECSIDALQEHHRIVLLPL